MSWVKQTALPSVGGIAQAAGAQMLPVPTPAALPSVSLPAPPALWGVLQDQLIGGESLGLAHSSLHDMQVPPQREQPFWDIPEGQ